MNLRFPVFFLGLLLAAHGLAASPQIDFATDALLIVYKENASQEDRRAARQSVKAKIRDQDGDERDDRFRHFSNGRYAKYQLHSTSVEQAMQTLRQHPAIDKVEPDYRVAATHIPNDEYFSLLWGLHNTGQSSGKVDADIDAPEAWDITRGSQRVVVGIIDSGMDYTHPDLVNNVWRNPGEVPGNGVDDDDNGYIDDVYGIDTENVDSDPMDDNGHGTHVAGIIGAEGNNGIGVVGVNHEVTLLPCKFLGSDGYGYISSAIECMAYLLELKRHGVNLRIMNNSWGWSGGYYSEALANYLSDASYDDVMFVASAGNESSNNDVSLYYPASYDFPNVVSVASVDRNDGLSYFSSYGATTVDLGAPGQSILSTVPRNGYATYSGTSMAAPHVSGAAALLWAWDPTLSAYALKNLLMKSGDPNPSLEGVTVSGNRLNVAQALAMLEPGFFLAIEYEPEEPVESGEAVEIQISVNAIAGWQGEVQLALTESPIEGAYLSSNRVNAGETVTLTIPTQAPPHYGVFYFTVEGKSNGVTDSVEARIEILTPPTPPNLYYLYKENNAVLNVPNPAFRGVTSTIQITEDLEIFETQVFANVTHPDISDLSIYLESPSGTYFELWDQDIGANIFYRTLTTSDFNGESTRGDWKLHVYDKDPAHQGLGTLNQWTLNFTTYLDMDKPYASFTYKVQGLVARFTDTSMDVTTNITHWRWQFGDGTTANTQNPVHRYEESGTYHAVLQVRDANGYTDRFRNTVYVGVPTPLNARILRTHLSLRGVLRVELEWSGSVQRFVDLFRNGEKIATVDNGGSYLDVVYGVSSGMGFEYQVCDAAGGCSEPLVVQY